MAQRPRCPRIFGDYALLRPIAEARAEGVYLATSRTLAREGRACVVKVRRAPTNPSHQTDDVARSAACPELLERGRIAEHAFVALELIEGRDLFELWNRCAQMRRAIDAPTAIAIWRGTLEALGALHDLGATYAQLCPSKVLLSVDGRVRLAEAEMRIEQTPPDEGFTVGRPGYMAPELLERGLKGARADVYAAGVIVWELLAGRTLWAHHFLGGATSEPFTARLAALRRTMATTDVPPPSSSGARRPHSFDGPVLRAVSREPGLRFGHAGHFLQELDAAVPPNVPSKSFTVVLQEIFGAELEVERRERRELVERGNALLGGSSLRGPAPSTQIAPRPLRPPAMRPEYPLQDVDTGGDSLDRARASRVRLSPSETALLPKPAVAFASHPSVPTSVPTPIEGSAKRSRPPIPVVTMAAIAAAAAAALFILLRRPVEDAPRPAARVEQTVSVPPPPGERAGNPLAAERQLAIPDELGRIAPEEVQRARESRGTTATAENSLAGSRVARRDADEGRAAMLLKQAQEAYDRSSFSVAIKRATHALGAGAGADAHVIVGDAYLALNEWKRAEKSYRKALKLNRRTPGAALGLRKALDGALAPR